MLCRFYAALSVCVLTLAGCGSGRTSPIDASNSKEAWNALNDPLNLRDQYEVRIAELPGSADLERKPWTDTYWPNYRGGLADRWNDASKPDSFSYALNTEAAVRSMSESALAQLSPAEKYDIFLGNYSYPFVQYERRRTSPDHPGWFGLCHGWAAAAINFNEPKPVTMQGAGGIPVPFGSSDVKALLLFAQQEGRNTRFAGGRCNTDNASNNSPECRDINAGSFHIVLTNQIALLHQGFVAEINRSSQVWNQPVYGYSTEIRGETTDIYASAAPGTVRILNVHTTLRYIVEVAPQWQPLPFDDFPGQGDERRYDYNLEVNDAGEIIGGEWLSVDHPDFVWTQEPPVFEGYFQEVARIYDAAIQ